MRARDVIGRKIVGVRQQRTTTRLTGGYGIEGDDSKELEWAWDVRGLELDNGKVLMLMAQETDTDPVVTAWVTDPRKDGDK